MTTRRNERPGRGDAPPAAWWRSPVVAGALLVLAAAAAHAPALLAGFVFDDVPLLLTSGFIRGPYANLWLGSDAPDYLPVTWSTFWLEWRLWGDAAAGYHAVNLLLHAGAALLLWRVLRALRIPAAWLGALLFAAHPVAVDSVAWVSERKNTVSAVLFLGALATWLAAERRDEAAGTARWSRWRAGALALFVAAALAKASVVMLPVVLLGIARFRRGALRRSDAALAAPFFAVSLVVGIATVVLHRANALGDAPMAQRGIAERLGGAAWALLHYLRTAIAPAGVAFVYPEWPVPASSPAFYGPAALVLAGAVALWLLRDRAWARACGWAAAYHAAMVLPVLGLVDMSYLRVGPVGNHLQYLALFGPAALGGAAFSRLEEWTGRARALAVAAAAVALLSASTFSRAGEFQDDLTLWTAAVRDAPGSAFAHKQRAAALAAAGRTGEALDEIEAFARTTRDPAEAHRARSVRLSMLGRLDEAVVEARAAESLRSDPEFRVDLGRKLTIAGKPLPAIELLEPVVRGAPGEAEPRLWLGLALVQVGRAAEAVEVLAPAARRAPADRRIADALAAARAAAGPR